MFDAVSFSKDDHPERIKRLFHGELWVSTGGPGADQILCSLDTPALRSRVCSRTMDDVEEAVSAGRDGLEDWLLKLTIEIAIAEEFGALW